MKARALFALGIVDPTGNSTKRSTSPPIIKAPSPLFIISDINSPAGPTYFTHGVLQENLTTLDPPSFTPNSFEFQITLFQSVCISISPNMMVSMTIVDVQSLKDTFFINALPESPPITNCKASAIVCALTPIEAKAKKIEAEKNRSHFMAISLEVVCGKASTEAAFNQHRSPDEVGRAGNDASGRIGFFAPRHTTW
jgi:hypothetical protein